VTLPAFLFGLMCALLIGTLFHLWVGGGPGRLLLYLVLSAAGFAIGNWLGTIWQWTFLRVGPLNMGMAIVGSVFVLGIGHWLSMVQVTTSGRAGRL
jgi:hypothetical protein